MASLTVGIGADLNEAFKLQEFTSRDQYPVLDVMDEEIEKHYNESFEKKFEEMFQKRFDEEFNKRIELLVAQMEEPKSRFDIFGYIKSSIKNVLVAFLNILKENQYLRQLYNFSTQRQGMPKTTEIEPEEMVPIPEIEPEEMVPIPEAEPCNVELKPFTAHLLEDRYNTLLKQRDNEDRELVVSKDDAIKKFNEFNKNRNTLVNKVYLEEIKKRGYDEVTTTEVVTQSRQKEKLE